MARTRYFGVEGVSSRVEEQPNTTIHSGDDAAPAATPVANAQSITGEMRADESHSPQRQQVNDGHDERPSKRVKTVHFDNEPADELGDDPQAPKRPRGRPRKYPPGTPRSARRPGASTIAAGSNLLAAVAGDLQASNTGRSTSRPNPFLPAEIDVPFTDRGDVTPLFPGVRLGSVANRANVAPAGAPGQDSPANDRDGEQSRPAAYPGYAFGSLAGRSAGASILLTAVEAEDSEEDDLLPPDWTEYDARETVVGTTTPRARLVQPTVRSPLRDMSSVIFARDDMLRRALAESGESSQRSGETQEESGMASDDEGEDDKPFEPMDGEEELEPLMPIEPVREYEKLDDEASLQVAEDLLPHTHGPMTEEEATQSTSDKIRASSPIDDAWFDKHFD